MAAQYDLGSDPRDEVGGRYARYVLAVLVVVYVFNFIDRQIVSILAEEIKADLGIDDSTIGFLYGTAFAVFYAVFGIPLGRLADVWDRRKLISIGLAFWSVMTALSGTARSFYALAGFRFGVGVGEATASPAAYSILSDYFPARLRATALAIYSSGIYIGAGIGVFIGGVILDAWQSMYPDPALAPFGLKGWHVAFFAVGVPGLLASLWVWTLREPRRGMSDGYETATEPHPFRVAFASLMAVLPPLTLVTLARSGDNRALAWNVLAAAVIALVAWALTVATDNPPQWIALGIGVYATVSWSQNLARQDRATFAMIFGSPAMRCAMIGFPSISFVTYGLGFWSIPYMIRAHGVDEAEVGTILGLGAALGGWIGVTLGGYLSDVLRRRFVNGRLYIGLAVPLLSVPVGLVFATTEVVWVAYLMAFLFSIVSPLWIGPAASTVNDLVLPRMRALASAFYILLNTFIGLALGPYFIGKVSDVMMAGGATDAAALRTGMIASLAMFLVSLAFLGLGMRYLGRDEAGLLGRARAAGEPG